LWSFGRNPSSKNQKPRKASLISGKSLDPGQLSADARK
jgi:hypothetical protein